MLRYKDVETRVFKKLASELDDTLLYHDIKHTADVIRAAERLCYMEGLNNHDTVLVRTAALFHDIGFCEFYMDNEVRAAELAEEYLPKYGYTPEDIAQIKAMIMATRIPHNPQNLMEQIICDADLDYLGREDFHPISQNLKHEFMHYKVVNTSMEWDQIQVRFFEIHHYFTPSAKALREAKKAKHLEEIRIRLASYA
jgi:predicted metal-dependent HD superfamily phosphohydrolase